MLFRLALADMPHVARRLSPRRRLLDRSLATHGWWLGRVGEWRAVQDKVWRGRARWKLQWCVDGVSEKRLVVQH